MKTSVGRAAATAWGVQRTPKETGSSRKTAGVSFESGSARTEGGATSHERVAAGRACSKPVDQPAEAFKGIAGEARITQEQRIILENAVLELGARLPDTAAEFPVRRGIRPIQQQNRFRQPSPASQQRERAQILEGFLGIEKAGRLEAADTGRRL